MNEVAEGPAFHLPLFRAWAALPPHARPATIKKAERLAGPAAKVFEQLFSAIDSDGAGVLDEAKGRVYLMTCT